MFLWIMNFDLIVNMHVFGVKSPPDCKNYALKFGDAKSLKIISKRLCWWHAKISKIWRRSGRAGKLMCKYGGLHLTKFLTNNKQVLEAEAEKLLVLIPNIIIISVHNTLLVLICSNLGMDYHVSCQLTWIPVLILQWTMEAFLYCPFNTLGTTLH